MKRIFAVIIDYFICHVFACICRLFINPVLIVLFYRYSSNTLPLFLKPIEILYIDEGVCSFFNYGFFSLEGLWVYSLASLIIYVVISELVFNGKTIAKKMLKLKVFNYHNKNFLWYISRIVLKLISIKFWYIFLLYYMQYLKMPYDKRLGIEIRDVKHK